MTVSFDCPRVFTCMFSDERFKVDGVNPRGAGVKLVSVCGEFDVLREFQFLC